MSSVTNRRIASNAAAGPRRARDAGARRGVGKAASETAVSQVESAASRRARSFPREAGRRETGVRRAIDDPRVREAIIEAFVEALILDLRDDGWI